MIQVLFLTDSDTGYISQNANTYNRERVCFPFAFAFRYVLKILIVNSSLLGLLHGVNIS